MLQKRVNLFRSFSFSEFSWVVSKICIVKFPVDFRKSSLIDTDHFPGTF